MFHPEYPDIRSKQYLIFGIHIRKLATILSAFSIVAEIILIAVARIDLFSYFFAAICIVSNVLVIYADKSEMPKYYWPFLVLTLIILVFGGIFILASIVLMIHFLISVFVGGAQFDQDVRVENFDDKFAPKTLGEGLFWLFLLCIVISALLSFKMFHFLMVYRSKNYILEEVWTGNTRRVFQDKNDDNAETTGLTN